MTNEAIVAQLVASKALVTASIIRAFVNVDRSRFVPTALTAAAYEDRPLPLAEGATISQPTTVAMMLELLQPAKDDKILDVGAGSGWTTALLAECVGPHGSVIGTEIATDLVATGRRHIAEITNATIVPANAEPGIPGEQFDKILVSAAVQAIPETLVRQLVVGGTMVIPVKYSLHTVVRISEDDIDAREYPGFIFVPLR